MNACPYCDHSIQVDFGITTCDACGVALFIDMEGNIKANEDSPESGEELEGSKEYQEEDKEEYQEEHPLESQDAQGDQEDQGDQDSQQELSDAEDLSGTEESSDAEDLSGTEESSDAEESNDNESSSNYEDFSDVKEFGNSSQSQAGEGACVYSVTVKGIDTKDLSSSVFDALTDSRLGLDISPESVKEGVLYLKGLNPVQASVIVNRLKSIAVEINWVQYSLMDTAMDTQDPSAT